MTRLPQGIRNIKRGFSAAFNQWKSESQPTNGDSYFYYRDKRKTTKYRQALRNFIVDKDPGGDSLSFGTGVLMSSNFLRPPNNQINIFKDPK